MASMRMPRSDRLAHVVDRQQRRPGRGERLHLDAGAIERLRSGLDRQRVCLCPASKSTATRVSGSGCASGISSACAWRPESLRPAPRPGRRLCASLAGGSCASGVRPHRRSGPRARAARLRTSLRADVDHPRLSRGVEMGGNWHLLPAIATLRNFARFEAIIAPWICHSSPPPNASRDQRRWSRPEFAIRRSGSAQQTCPTSATRRAVAVRSAGAQARRERNARDPPLWRVLNDPEVNGYLNELGNRS